MGEISFGRTVGMLEHAMAGAGTAHEAIANNIANVNTPNFRRTDVSFKEALARTEAGPDDGSTLAVTATNERHFAIGGPAPAEPFAVTATVDETEQMRVDGSNVDVDQEMAKLSLNSGYAQTMAQLLTTQFSRMREAIQERF